MKTPTRLKRAFFDRPTLQVARDLLGQRLVRLEGGIRIAGLITETEAYCGETDLACHARVGRTSRTEVMYGPPGHAYVYFTYGMHWLLNFVTRPAGIPEAVLLRGIQPTEGLAIIEKRRGTQPQTQWTNGPAKLSQALGIDKHFNGADLTDPEAHLFVESTPPVPEVQVWTGSRVGIDTAPEPWKSKPWRFLWEIPTGERTL